MGRLYRIFEICWKQRDGWDRSFKMASKSKELLAGDDIEGILAVIDSDILVESNDLETEFTATVFKIQDINSESCFLCQNCRKTYKTKKRIKSSSVN